ncbi:MAG: ABC transporter permease, partial [Sediminibacterium sp.]
MTTTHHTSSLIKRLLRNKGAAFGLILITLSLLLVIFGYFIAPDGSPNANRMIPEIGSKKPGFEVNLLLIKREQSVQSTSFFSKLINGTPDQ